MVDQFITIPPEQFVDKEIDCVYELTKFAYKKLNFSEKAASLFWSIATQTQSYKPAIVEQALDRFIDVIRNWEREQKGEYLLLCIQNIKEHKAQVQSIRIAMKILDLVPSYK